VQIDTFRSEHARAFDLLNRAWLVEHELLEPADEEHLLDPWTSIISPGGQIFVAVRGKEVLGTCAIAPLPPAAQGESMGGRTTEGNVAEIVKLVVAPVARGQGLGRRLLEACLAYAREEDIRQVVLLSSSKLGSALRLYEAMGFQHQPLPAGARYATADVYMKLNLDPRQRSPAR
jgi:GNAT superfamily N-acetyltransferase